MDFQSFSPFLSFLYFDKSFTWRNYRPLLSDYRRYRKWKVKGWQIVTDNISIFHQQERVCVISGWIKKARNIKIKSYDHVKICLRYWKSTKTVGESYMIQIYNILSAFYLSANPFIPDTGWLVWSKPFTFQLTIDLWRIFIIWWFELISKYFVEIFIY